MLTYDEIGANTTTRNIDDYSGDVREVIDDISEMGWEIPTRELFQVTHVIRDKRRVLAVGYYALPSEALVGIESAKPLLIWQVVETGETMIRSYETEYARIIEANEGLQERAA